MADSILAKLFGTGWFGNKPVYAGTVDPQRPDLVGPVNPAMPTNRPPGVQTNPYLTMPVGQRGSATGNGEYGVPSPYATNPNVNPPDPNRSEGDLSNPRFRYLRPDHPPIPVDPDRMKRDGVFASAPAVHDSLQTNPLNKAMTAPSTPAPPAPHSPVPTQPGYEYVQVVNPESGNLVWTTRPKGFTGTFGGLDAVTPGMTQPQADVYNRTHNAGSVQGAPPAPGSGLMGLLNGLKAPPGAMPSAPPGVGGPMIPNGPGLTVPSNYNADGSGLSAQEVLGANPGLGVDPQAALPAAMKGSPLANFLQFLGMTGG